MSNPGSPRILALTDEEQEWLTSRLQAAEESGLLSDVPLVESFDASRDEWHALPAAERGSPGMIVNIYGAAFGQLMSQEFDLQWCAVERDGAGQLGLYGATGSIVFFPLETVAQRWEDPAHRSLADLFSQVRESLTAVQGAI